MPQMLKRSSTVPNLSNRSGAPTQQLKKQPDSTPASNMKIGVKNLIRNSNQPQQQQLQKTIHMPTKQQVSPQTTTPHFQNAIQAPTTQQVSPLMTTPAIYSQDPLPNVTSKPKKSSWCSCCSSSKKNRNTNNKTYSTIGETPSDPYTTQSVYLPEPNKMAPDPAAVKITTETADGKMVFNFTVNNNNTSTTPNATPTTVA